MCVIYFNNTYRGMDNWTTRREDVRIVRILERNGLGCNESILIIF